MLVAVDPGVHASGLAVFTDGLLSAAYYTGDPTVLDWVPADAKVIVELPQVYRHGKGDPNDLVDLAFAAGRITRRFELVATTRPGQWKGQTPKAVHHARVRKALLPAEEDVLARAQVARAKAHNVLDAVALGLWRLGRL